MVFLSVRLETTVRDYKCLPLFKECLANNIVSFIITDELKRFYYRGLQEWGHIDGYLTDICLTAQDQYKDLLRYFIIKM